MSRIWSFTYRSQTQKLSLPHRLFALAYCNHGMFTKSLRLCVSPLYVNHGVLRRQCRKLSGEVVSTKLADYENFMRSKAKVEPPSRLSTLLDFLVSKGNTLVNPNDRTGLNPFLIPIARDGADQSLLCYMRWPTQREEMPLQLVRTTQAGVRLVSLSTDNLCHRYAVEMDFRKEPNAAAAIDKFNNGTQLYTSGDYNTFLNSGKFPKSTEKELNLVLDRYLLTKVGPFPDCYERLAQNFYDNNNTVSALITCERAVSLFYSWGHPLHFHMKMLRDAGRPEECLEAARSAMGLPKWTLASDQAVSSLLHLFFFALRAYLATQHE